MTISSISATPAGSTAFQQPAAAAPPSQAFLDREAFLKLLVAQLRYQDPSKPIDSGEMIAQSAQLSVVDKLAEIATTLERSAASDRLALAGSIIGKQISFAGPDGYPLTAKVQFVSFENGNVMLGAGGWDVPYEAVLAVADAEPAAAGTAAPAPPAAPAPATPPTNDLTAPEAELDPGTEPVEEPVSV